MKAVELRRPHGFLFWKGKKSAIASDHILPYDERLAVVCDGEIYGEVLLEQPMAVTVSVFDKEIDLHSVKPEERRLWWPDATALYIHKFKDVSTYKEMKPAAIVDGMVVIKDIPEATVSQKAIIKRAANLPGKIILDDYGIIIDDSGNAICNKNISVSEISNVLKAVFGEDYFFKKSLDKIGLPIYQLCLVRNPKLIFEQLAEDKQNDDTDAENMEVVIMPYEIVENDDGTVCVIKDNGDPVECFDGEGALEKATVLFETLNALQNAEVEPEPETEPESETDEEMESMDEEKPDEKQEGFDESEWTGDAAEWEDAMSYCSDSLIDVNPSGEDKVKDLCKLPYRKSGSQNPNINALRAIVGGRGITAVEKPADVDQEIWDRELKAAANKIIDWYPDAFEKPAPESVYKIAGKEPPMEESAIEEEAEPAEKEESEKAGRRLRATWKDEFQKIIKVLKEFIGWAEYDDVEKMITTKTGFAIKEVKGDPWFFAWSTNAFEDREKETFSTKSLETYVLEAEKAKDRGYFNFWHIPGTDFAAKKWQGVIGRILVEAGPFLDNEKGQAAKKFFMQYKDRHPTLAPEGWGMSPEFRYLPEDRVKGVYTWIWITRTSTLPRAAAANIFTKGSVTMALTDSQKDGAKELFGEDLALQIIENAEAETKTLEEAGVAHKEKEDQPSEEKQTICKCDKKDYDIEEVVKMVVEAIDLSPLYEGVTKLAEEIKQLKQEEETKNKVETPKFSLYLKQRASQSEKTELSEDDNLKQQKPVEADPLSNGSVAQKFFPGK